MAKKSAQNTSKSDDKKVANSKPLDIRQILILSEQTQAEMDKAGEQVKAHREESQALQASVSQLLMVAARPFGTDYEAFLNACSVQEKWLKSEEAGKDKVDAIPRCFTQAKSNLKQAMMRGIDPNGYETESELRAELNKARKAEKEGETTTHTFAADSDLGIVLNDLMDICHNVPEAQIPQVVAYLKGSADDLRTMIGLEKDLAEVDETAPAQAASK